LTEYTVYNSDRCGRVDGFERGAFLLSWVWTPKESKWDWNAIKVCVERGGKIISEAFL